MKAIASSEALDHRWTRVSAISGLVGLVAYAGTSVASHSTSNIIVIPLVYVFAFGLTVASIGLYHVLGGAKGPRIALIAAVANVIAAGQLVAMLMVQQAVWATVDQPDAALKGVWWGLDVAWDFYVGTGTILFALCMFGRRGLGAWLGVPGVLIGSLLLIFNLATFPTPPANAGLVDLGPLLGLWYMVVFVRLGASSAFLARQHRRVTA